MATWDEVDLLDMTYEEPNEMYTYPCPCGDFFVFSLEDVYDLEEIAPCPSCSLLLRVKYDPEEFLSKVEIVSPEQSTSEDTQS